MAAPGGPGRTPPAGASVQTDADLQRIMRESEEQDILRQVEAAQLREAQNISRTTARPAGPVIAPRISVVVAPRPTPVAASSLSSTPTVPAPAPLRAPAQVAVPAAPSADTAQLVAALLGRLAATASATATATSPALVNTPSIPAAPAPIVRTPVPIVAAAPTPVVRAAVPVVAVPAQPAAPIPAQTRVLRPVAPGGPASVSFVPPVATPAPAVVIAAPAPSFVPYFPPVATPTHAVVTDAPSGLARAVPVALARQESAETTIQTLQAQVASLQQELEASRARELGYQQFIQELTERNTLLTDNVHNLNAGMATGIVERVEYVGLSAVPADVLAREGQRRGYTASRTPGAGRGEERKS